MDDTLFDRIGGDAAMTAAVDGFYRKVLGDERIARFFDDTDMEAQVQSQRDFLTMAFGGPNRYQGQQMGEAHAELVDRGLSDFHFDVVVELLAETLQELGVGGDMIGEVAAIAESVRNDVLGRSKVTG